MKRLPLLIALLGFLCTCVRAQTTTLRSPDQQLRVTVTEALPLVLKLYAGEEELATIDDIHLRYGEAQYPSGAQKIGKPIGIDQILTPIVATKNAEVRELYNVLTLTYEDGTAVKIRLYNDGLAYRITKLPAGRLTEEHFDLALADSTELFYPKEESFYSHNERIFLRGTTADFADSLASLPVLGVLPSGYHVWVSESNLYDYPGLWLRAYPGGLRGTHPALPETVTYVNDMNDRIDSRYDYLAEIEAGQSTPWRIVGVSKTAAGLLNNQLTYLLADAHDGDFSWVRPGQVSWDWYNANNIYGVDFAAGFNTQTYKYYIDFASAHGIPYIILDEGWSVSEQITTVVPEINMQELVAYGKEKNVKLILWALWRPFCADLENVTATYEKWGIAGVKIDFMQRDDQQMVQHYRAMAEATARHKLLIDFHGSYKPAGLHRTFPNVITREGVKGLEWNKFGKPGSGIGPEHDVTLPFTRMVAGPMDFTPGAMRNVQPKNHRYVYSQPMSQGTRAHQLAMYVVYESPLQMLADSPSAYEREAEVTTFITSVPTTWRRTVPLAGVVGDYVVVARQAEDDSWYVGALNDLTEREITVSLDFLPAGTYALEIFRDGVNHKRFAEDYVHERVTVKSGALLRIPLGEGGGWVGRLVRK